VNWTVYLSGEIHTNWRTQIAEGIQRSHLSITLMSPVLDHTASDNCGTQILGGELEGFWKDHQSAKLNAIRTRHLIQSADVVVVRFGDKYRQWNAAFDAGYATALGKPLITLHAPDLIHALKEVDAAAYAVAQTAQEVVDILRYATHNISITADNNG